MIVTPAGLLRSTAAAYRDGAITWIAEWFIGLDPACRCTLGGIAWVADPADLNGNPLYVDHNLRPTTRRAVEILADYLVDELGAERLPDTDDTDGVIETVGRWNDAPGRETVDVVAALEGAAAHAEQVCR